MKNKAAFKFFNLCLFLLLYSCSIPTDDEKQTTDKSDPNDNTSELPWSGQTEKFDITPKKGIRLNDPEKKAGTAYLSIPSNQIRETRWEFEVHLSFNPSANNYARFYLASSSENLSAETDGYFIQIGGASDNTALYRQNGEKVQLLASGRELMKGNNAPKLKIKVECDANGYWTFWTQTNTEEEYIKEKQVKDTGIESCICCGILCVYTASRCKDFAFQHVQISHDVETTTLPEDNPDTPEIPGDNPELPDNVKGMLLFNEVMYHNASDGAEYIEFYNPTESEIKVPSLLLYKMKEDGTVFSTTTLLANDGASYLTFPSKGYICFTKSVQTLINKHNAPKAALIETPNFPTLSDSGGYLALVCTDKRLIDKCCFFDWMHSLTPAKYTIGVSLEKRSPGLSSINANWRSSQDTTGGTPGKKNSEE